MSSTPDLPLLHRAIYLTGPTASGKTAVGVALAQRINAEVIALDSMTLYRGMDIGTAKPTLAERAGIPHHLIDVLDPWESASVAEYRERASQIAAEIEGRGKKVLFVGGTALYLKALLRGLFEGPAAVPELRKELEAEAERWGSEKLHARLFELDPVTAQRLHPNDQRRLVRALEVITVTGRPLSELQTEHERVAPPEVPVFALQRPRGELHNRIDRRVLAMFQEGFVQEVRALSEGPRPMGSVAAQGVGYREVLEHLETGLSLKETVTRIQARTRQFAKRQETWFRGLAEVKLWPVEMLEPPEQTAERLVGRLVERN